jgi:hypothetical protein
MCPETVSTPRITESTPMELWVIISMVRLGKRSASTPPQTEKSRMGRNCRAVTTPSAVPLWVSVSTSQSWAMRCIQVPVLETTCPAAKSR